MNVLERGYNHNSDLVKLHDLPVKVYSDLFLREYGGLEVLRGQRYGKTFSIIHIEVESFQKVLDREVYQKRLKEIAKTIGKATRVSDILGIRNDKEFILILPETDYFDALIRTRRLRRALKKIHEYEGLSFLLVVVSFPHDGRDFDGLLESASLKTGDYRKSLYYTLEFENKGFWECIQSLFEVSKGSNGDFISPGKMNRDWRFLPRVSNFFVNKLLEVIFKEILRTPKDGGILYSSLYNKKVDGSFLKDIAEMKDIRTKIFLLCNHNCGSLKRINANYLNLKDEKLLKTPFLLLFRKDFAYAIICYEEDNELKGFHTMDPFLVEGLISKLQEKYSLQEQL